MGDNADMSPEILMGEEFGLPTDVYSLGVIFVEILTRRLVDGTTFAVRPSLRPTLLANPSRSAKCPPSTSPPLRSTRSPPRTADRKSVVQGKSVWRV